MLRTLLTLIGRPRPTFGQLADQWLADAARRCSPGYVEDARRLLRVELARLTPLRTDRLSRRDIASALECIEGSGTHNQALALASSIFGWAVATGRHEGTNVASGLRKRPLRVRDRVLTAQEIALVWEAADPARLRDIGRIVRLLLCTGLRRGEVGGLLWAEVNLAEQQLELPAGRMKAGRAHIVPLTDLALAQLSPARPGHPHVFGRRRGQGFSGRSQGKGLLDAQLGGMAPWTMHDLRKTVATRLGDLGVGDDVVGRLLAHAPQSVTRRHYNHSARLAEQRAALEAWAAHVGRLVRAPSNPCE